MNFKKGIFATLISICMISTIIIVYLKSKSNEYSINPWAIKIQSFGDYTYKENIENYKFSNKCKEKISNLGKYTNNVYKVNNKCIDKKILNNVKLYSKENNMNFEKKENSLYLEKRSTKFKSIEDEIIEKNKVENAKKIYSNEINCMLKLFDLTNRYNDNNIKVYSNETVDYEKDGKEYKEQVTQIGFKCNLDMNTSLKCLGDPPALRFVVDSKDNIVEIDYNFKNINKVGKKYKLKTLKEISYDIENDNNVMVDIYNDTIENIIFDDVELVLYVNSHNEKFKYMVPYYRLSSNSDGEKIVDVLLPAIKNKYLKLVD